MLAWLPRSNYELFHHVIQGKRTSLGDLSHLLKQNAASRQKWSQGATLKCCIVMFIVYKYKETIVIIIIY